MKIRSGGRPGRRDHRHRHGRRAGRDQPGQRGRDRLRRGVRQLRLPAAPRIAGAAVARAGQRGLLGAPGLLERHGEGPGRSGCGGALGDSAPSGAALGDSAPSGAASGRPRGGPGGGAPGGGARGGRYGGQGRAGAG
ncbi:hypothetical protein E6W39_31665 [Kitasatospora acidiphila]|uniref:Uncharacterized protein n=1 Tax=Kitasatospora acidiphila TaxID=2567942 RepID=A0A540WAB0_9ACTN|nr:hypothetical protein E6W39_31665 [Kitasatospora acidiphila]